MRRVAVLTAAKNDQGKLFPEEEDTPPVVRELQEAGLSTQDALTIWQQGFRYVNEDARPEGLDEDAGANFVRYIREKIHLMTCRQASGKVTNSTGFLLEAIKKNYANPAFVQEHKRKIGGSSTDEAGAGKQVQVLEQQKAEIETARDTELEHMYGHIALEAPLSSTRPRPNCGWKMMASSFFITREVRSGKLSVSSHAQRIFSPLSATP
jgi:hypothetical protein